MALITRDLIANSECQKSSFRDLLLMASKGKGGVFWGKSIGFFECDDIVSLIVGGNVLTTCKYGSLKSRRQQQLGKLRPKVFVVCTNYRYLGSKCLGR
jgi:hypothetical protein